MSDVRGELTATRTALATLKNEEEKGGEPGQPFMSPFMEEMKRLSEALDALSDKYGIADEEAECSDLFHDVMGLNNAILKSLGTRRVPQVPPAMCQDDFGGPGGPGPGMGGSGPR